VPIYIVPSVSTPETAYEVDTDKPSCNCPAFKHSRGRQWCKHLTMVEARPGRYASIDNGAAIGATKDASPGLFTIGHSNHSIQNFLSLLRQHHIRAVVDVRSSPYSRYSPHFCRDALRRYVRAEGIDYFWAGKELGGRGKIPVGSAAFYGRMNQIVEMAGRIRIALLCSEGKPEDCHRAMKLTAWVHREADGYARHILRDGSLLSSEVLEQKMGPEWLWVDYGGEKGK
jgi:hypothetical protein